MIKTIDGLIDLQNRKMIYAPWHMDHDGHNQPASKKEIENTYTISGQAVAEVLDYFEKRAEIELGISAEEATSTLIARLNFQMPADRYRVNRIDLKDTGRFYSNEFYFYFIINTKFIMKRQDFHFGENDHIALNNTHKIYEKGTMEYPPFGIFENKLIHDVTSANNLMLLIYLEQNLHLDTTDYIILINSFLKKPYQIDRNFYNNEANWCSLEFIEYGFELFKVFANSDEALYTAPLVISGTNLKIGRLIANVPESLLFKGFTTTVRKMNDMHECTIKKFSKTRIDLKVRIKDAFNIKQYGQYLSSGIYNDALVWKGSVSAFMRVIYQENLVPESKMEIQENGFMLSFSLLETRRIVLVSFLIFIMGGILGVLLVQLLKLSLVISSVSAFILTLLTVLYYQSRRKVALLTKKMNMQFEASREQLEQLEITSQELVKEKLVLEDKVKSRTEELMTLNDKLQLLDQAKTQFFANISHELRTPLTLILGPLDLIIKGEYGEKLSCNDERLFSIKANTLRLLHLINNLLDYSKIESGKMIVNKQPTELNKVIDYYLATINSAAEARKLNIHFIKNKKKIITALDRDLFEKAFFNILSNAMKFTPEGGKISISLTHYQDKNKREFNVLKIKDTGIGIPKEKQDLVFERFVQIDGSSNRKYEGTGIGLSFTKEIMEMHDGKIEMKSEMGKGTEFLLYFPYNQEEIKDYQENEITDVKEWLLSDIHFKKNNIQQNENISVQKDLSVLVVDDNNDIREFIKNLLKSNYNIFLAENGLKGFESAKKHLPDIIISDVMMPICNGYEMTKKLKLDPDTKNIPVILLTAKADLDNKIEGLETGADDYLAKPFNQEELLIRIKNLLDNRKIQIQLAKNQKEINSDLIQASEVQKNILTKKSYYKHIDGLDIDILYQPMNGLISGDYYHLSELNSGLTSVLLADAAGHGVQAALSTMQLDLLARDAMEMENPGLRHHFLNKQLIENLTSINFFTAFWVDILHDKIRYASAGHPAQLLICAEEMRVVRLKSKGSILGMIPESDYGIMEHSFQRGDVLFLFTDGLFEEFNRAQEEYGEDRLWSMFESRKSDLLKMDNSQILSFFKNELNTFIDKKEFMDDITLIVIRRT